MYCMIGFWTYSLSECLGVELSSTSQTWYGRESLIQGQKKGFWWGFLEAKLTECSFRKENVVAESQDFKLAEGIENSCNKQPVEKVIKFHTSDDYVIFDDQVELIYDTDLEWASEVEDIRKISSSESELAFTPGVSECQNAKHDAIVEESLQSLKYHPGWRCSTRCTAGEPPEYPGHDYACVMVIVYDVSGDKPASYEDAMSRPASNKWKEVLQFQFDLIEKFGTWELAEVPPDRKLIKHNEPSM